MRTDFPTVGPDARTTEVARLMLHHSVRGIPVLDARSRLLGLVTETDLVTKHANVHVPVYLGILGGVIPFERRGTDEEIQRALAVTAGDLMERDVARVGPDATVDDVATLMVEDGADPVLVVENGVLTGLISRTDIIQLLIVEEEEGEPHSAG
jgi:CBS domain-containing protein